MSIWIHNYNLTQQTLSSVKGVSLTLQSSLCLCSAPANGWAEERVWGSSVAMMCPSCLYDLSTTSFLSPWSSLEIVGLPNNRISRTTSVRTFYSIASPTSSVPAHPLFPYHHSGIATLKRPLRQTVATPLLLIIEKPVQKNPCTIRLLPIIYL